MRGGRVRRGDGWEPVTARTETVKRRGSTPLELTLRETGHGVLEVDPKNRALGDGLYLARAWTGHRFGHAPSFAAIRDLPRARDVAAAQAVARTVTMSCNWVLADRHGGCLWLGERECSIQRRHQKVVEESPSPAVTPETRARMSAAAVAAATAVGYVNAGTVEFLLEPDGSFYFLEMNTRLQVEHPVTEEAWGLDLVALQLSVAAGEALPTDLASSPMAHSIEARVYAEDPENGFLPQVGTVLAYEEPGGPGVRVDSGIEEGSEVSVHYDPMLAKVVARGRTREEARRRLVDALGRTVILGVATNVSWLRRLLETPEFVRGDLDTSLLSRLELPPPSDPPAEVLGAAARVLAGGDGVRASGAPRTAFPDPFTGGTFRVLG